MQDQVVLFGAISIALVALSFLIRTLLIWKGQNEIVNKFDHYLPFAIAAAKWVEATVPDDFGADAEDSATTRAVHKLDLFLKKFTETVQRFDGKEPSEELKKEAMRWSVELAERLNIMKKDKPDA